MKSRGGPISIIENVPRHAFVGGWEQSFGRPIGIDRDWLLGRGSYLLGLDGQGEVVGGVGMRPTCVTAGSTTRLVGALHDAWIVPSRRGQGLSSTLVQAARARALKSGMEGVFALVNRERWMLPAFTSAGFNVQAIPIRVGRARALANVAKSPDLLHEFGTQSAGPLLKGGWPRVASGPAVHRTSDYVRNRFHLAPRRYIYVTILDARRQPQALCIAKPFPCRNTTHVLFWVGLTRQAAWEALSVIGAASERLMPESKIDIARDLCATFEVELASRGFIAAEDARVLVVSSPDPRLCDEWNIWRDESCAY